MKTLVALSSLLVATSAHAQCEGWSREFAPSPGGLGMNGTVNDFAVWNGSLYATGSFFEAGGTTANYLARWTGRGWAKVGSGGSFNGGGLDLPGYALAVYGNRLIIGGFFNSAGGVASPQIAAWNGSTYAPLGAGITGGFRRVNCLAVIGGLLYAGGTFTTAGGAPAANIATWNGSAWSALGSGTDNEVYCIAEYAGSVVVGGRFAAAGGSARRGIAVWNGTSWSDFPGGQTSFLGSVQTLTAESNILYVGGNFESLGSTAANDIAFWNGTSWNTMNGGLGGVGVGAITRFNGQLVIAGHFSQAGGRQISNIATWSPTEGYLPLAQGLGLNANAAVVFAEQGGPASLWIGGGFVALGDNTTQSSYIARWGTTCPAEMTCDGFIDIFDYEAFVSAFEAGD